MSSRPQRAQLCLKKNNKGFSLIEIIIALMFTSVIVLVLVTTMRFAVRSEEKGVQRQDASQHIRILSAQLSFLLKGVYPYISSANQEGQRLYYFEGASDSAAFITTSVSDRGDSLIDKPGLKWVMIHHDSEGLKIKENFFFLDDDYEGSSSRSRVLDDTVSGIDFEYLDLGENRDEDPEWSSQWSTDESEYLPAAVKVTLRIREDEEADEIELPPMVIRVQSSKKIE
ncbi:MAG: hypothetical protein JSV21_04730 [Nitrospirota bacterium]|nr:MAG: hypothetical protein JSV21_04730 [Nitrospirota bacterium]